LRSHERRFIFAPEFSALPRYFRSSVDMEWAAVLFLACGTMRIEASPLI
jgi:hypothetical protein